MEKQGLSDREAAAWAGFRAAASEIASDQRATLALNVDGWTAKDVLWHVAHWWDHLTGLLAAVREGTYEEPPEDDEATDVENAEVLAKSRAMSLEAVESGVAAARQTMLAAWTALPEVTEPAERWFVWETIDHYEEHLPELRTASAGS